MAFVRCNKASSSGGSGGVKVNRTGRLAGEGWYLNTDGVLKLDTSDPDCVLDVFPLVANHTYIWTYGENAGNRRTLATFSSNIYANPVNNTAGTKLFPPDGCNYIEFTPTVDGYLGAYIANNMGTNVDDYLVDITENTLPTVTPSNSSPASLATNTPVTPTTNGYAIESYNIINPSNSTTPTIESGRIYKMGATGVAVNSVTNKTPSDVSPASVSSGSIIKAMASGYLVSTGYKVKVGTATLSTSSTTKITCGFQPRYICLVTYSDSTHFCTAIYNYDVNSSLSFRSAMNGSSSTGAGTATFPTSSSTTTGIIMSTDSTGFTVNKSSTNHGTSAYYFAIG